MKLRQWFWGGIFCALAGCTITGGSPPPSYYILPAQSKASVIHFGSIGAIGIEPVKLPGYLDRPQIVTLHGQGQVRMAEFHRWAEPVAEGFERLLAGGIQERLPGSDVLLLPTRQVPLAWTVAVQVREFYVADQRCRLKASWQLRQGGRLVTLTKSAIEIPLGHDRDYPAIVAAMAQAVDRLAAEISAALVPPGA